jgi:hypothetical protein
MSGLCNLRLSDFHLLRGVSMSLRSSPTLIPLGGWCAAPGPQVHGTVTKRSGTAKAGRSYFRSVSYKFEPEHDWCKLCEITLPLTGFRIMNIPARPRKSRAILRAISSPEKSPRQSSRKRCEKNIPLLAGMSFIFSWLQKTIELAAGMFMKTGMLRNGTKIGASRNVL